MNCQEFWDSYPELTQSPQPHTHADECEACARQLAEQTALAAALRVAGSEGRSVQAPDRVERGLVAAFRVQHAHRERPRRLWLPVLTWASAAAVLIALAIFTIRAGRPVAAPHRPVARAIEWASTVAPADWTADEDAVSGDFIPLPNAEQVEENDDLNVVRVEVPRSAMLAVGLPVSLDRASELVEADVMVGADGLARAVRFVDE